MKGWAFLVPILAISACSDPVPPAPKAALESNIFTQGSCISPRTVLSVGEEAAKLRLDGGEARTDSGVSCSVSSNGAGFDFEGTIKEGEVLNGNATVTFSIDGSTQGSVCSKESPCTGQGRVSINDNYMMQLRNLTDPNCDFAVRIVKEGAIWATYRCSSLTDATPNNVCLSEGTFVFENCDK